MTEQTCLDCKFLKQIPVKIGHKDFLKYHCYKHVKLDDPKQYEAFKCVLFETK